MKLAFEALDARGQTHNDVMEADSRDDAMEILRRRGMFLTKIAPVEFEAEAQAAAGGRRITRRVLKRMGGRHKQLVLFTRQMAMMMGVGTGVVPALSAMAEQTRDERWKSVLERIHDDVEKGTSLAQAMTREPEYFDQVFTSMVAAGEATAMLPAMFDRLSNLAKQQWEVRARVIGATIYPCVLVGICVCVTAVLLFFVLPRFTILFTTLDVELPASTAQLMKLSDFLMANLAIVGSSIAGLVVGAILYCRSRAGRMHIGWLSIRLPVVGSLARSLALSRICRLLGLMIHARVPLLESVDLTRAAVKHKEFNDLLGSVRDEIVEGGTLAASLLKSPLVPASVYQGVSAGEESGHVGDALVFLADWMDDENKQQIGSLSKVFEPAMLIFMGFVVGGAAISLFMPLFDMASAAAG